MPQKKFIKETQLHYKSFAFLNPIFYARGDTGNSTEGNI